MKKYQIDCVNCGEKTNITSKIEPSYCPICGEDVPLEFDDQEEE